MFKEDILFTKDECDKIISYVQKWNNREISVDYDNKQTKVGGKMLSHTLIWTDENNWFIERIVNWVNNIPSIKKIKNNNIFAAYRNYKTGDYFIKHDDHIKGGAERIYTIGVHLNSQEDFTGGDFRIYKEGKDALIKFQTGKVYIFESSTPHSVDLITSGDRITLMLFVEKQNLIYENIKSKSLI